MPTFDVSKKMRKSLLPTWAVAAALILKEKEDYSHYTRLCSQIKKSGLSGLGISGMTPEQTMKTILITHEIQDRSKMFDPLGDGDYRLIDSDYTKTLPDVKEATRRLGLQKVGPFGEY